MASHALSFSLFHARYLRGQFFKKNEKIFDITIISTIVLFAGVMLTIIAPSYDDNDIKNGEIWSQCKILEENAYNGTFSDNVNKLECHGIIKNIPVSHYNKAIEAYKRQVQK